MDRGAWWATVYGVTKSQTQLNEQDTIIYGNSRGHYWSSFVSQKVKNLPAVQESWVRSLGWEDPLEKGMTTYSSILAWRIPWIGEHGRL